MIIDTLTLCWLRNNAIVFNTVLISHDNKKESLRGQGNHGP